jgi:hypothetical protein
MMGEMDGNNSLKRLRAFVHQAIDRPDTRGPRMDYWLDRATEVDIFEDEVKSRSVSISFSCVH